MPAIILPSITTAGSFRERWRDEIEDIARLNLARVALFLTGLSAEERQECYGRLQLAQTFHHFTIPFVHARSDMTEWEYHFLQTTFATRRFNLHPTSRFPLHNPLNSVLRQSIYVENDRSLYRQSFRGFAGLCLDLAHLESDRRAGRLRNYLRICTFVRERSVGVTHISASSTTPYTHKDGYISYAPHHLETFDQLNYVRTYPRRFFGPIIAIELENPLREQLEIRQYLEEQLYTPHYVRTPVPHFEPVIA